MTAENRRLAILASIVLVVGFVVAFGIGKATAGGGDGGNGGAKAAPKGEVAAAARGP